MTCRKDAEGSLFQGGSKAAKGQGWAAEEWISAGPAPTASIKSDRNNGFNTTNYNLGRDFKFTLSADEAYTIVGYNISTADGWGTTIVTEGGETAIFSGEQTLTVANLKTNSTWFSTADANLNNPVISVYLIDDQATENKPITSQAPPTKIYSLSGQRLNEQPRTGVFIVNNKKVMR